MKGVNEMTQQVEETKEQLDKALSEIDGVESNQMIFRIDSETFRFGKDEYKLIENYREAFDIEMMEQRFTDYLLKYDYIVGDIAYEKLRLRGFYDEHRKGVPIDMKITFLEDYLIEYCNFGCQYFVFERIDKKDGDPDSYFKRPGNKGNKNQKRRPNSRRRSNRGKDNQKPQSDYRQRTDSRERSNRDKQAKNTQKEFQVVKKQEAKAENTQAKQTKKPVAEKKAPKKQFEIRKKNN